MTSDNVPPAPVIEASIQDLTRRQELLTREFEENQQLLVDALAASTDVQGQGIAAEGAIVVTVGPDHRLIDLVLEPPALRLGSIQRLRDELMDAVNAAIDDADAQLRAAGGREATNDAVGSLLDRMPEVTALLPTSLTERLRAQPEARPVEPVRPSNLPDWNLDV